MNDLLTLDYSKYRNIKLVGFDLDAKFIALAKENALTHGKQSLTSFSQKDAWQL